jgi:hypothetical protein
MPRTLDEKQQQCRSDTTKKKKRRVPGGRLYYTKRKSSSSVQMKGRLPVTTKADLGGTAKRLYPIHKEVVLETQADHTSLEGEDMDGSQPTVFKRTVISTYALYLIFLSLPIQFSFAQSNMHKNVIEIRVVK